MDQPKAEEIGRSHISALLTSSVMTLKSSLVIIAMRSHTIY